MKLSSSIAALLILATMMMMSPAPAQELPPDDPAIAANLGAWFQDAANTFDTATGIWADSSGNDHHAVPVGEVNVNAPITYIAPTLATISGGAFSVDDVASVHFANDANDLLEASDISGGGGLSELTIFVVYNVDIMGGNASQTRPVGIGSISALQANPGNHFNLGSDPSIRKDNGQLGSGDYSQAFPFLTTFIRTARMSLAAIDEWFNIDGSTQKVINLTGSSFTTSSDDFFLGDLRAGADPIPGIAGGNPARSDFDIVQTIVYTSALTDAQILGVNEWLGNHLTGGDGGGGNSELAFTKILLSADQTTATLTWRSKPGKTYAIDFSTDLNADWQELNDDLPSEGADTTTFTAPTFFEPRPDPLPDRVFFRVREIQP